MKNMIYFSIFEQSETKIIAYHVTNLKNLKNILDIGLVTKVPEDYGDKGDEKGVYLFKSRDDMNNAVANWFGERIEEWEEESGESYKEIEIIVDITGLDMLDSVEFEWTVLEDISPDRIIDVRDGVYTDLSMGKSLL
jgi:hypothetical protein